MLRKIIFVVLGVFCFMNVTCEEDDIVNDRLCDFTTVVSTSKYNRLESDSFSISSAEINGDCLNISIVASGCGGENWEFQLIDSGAVAESLPEQRYLKLKFTNNEACLAVFTRSVSFDLKPVQVRGSSKIILHIDGLDGSLEYSY